MDILDGIVPKQKTGVKTGASAHVNCASLSEAEKLFEQASLRLLAINQWAKFSGEAGSEFCLTDQHGKPLTHAKPEIGNLIRITLPAPGNKAGSGYDWVKIEKIETVGSSNEPKQSLSMRVRPERNPLDLTGAETAHFYTKKATSTFSIIRNDTSVWAIEFGRNESANTKVSLLNSLRNFIIAIGARLGIAKMQWSSLMKGFLNDRK